MNHTLFLKQADALISGEPDALANAANLAALLYQEWQGINWAGFYLRRDSDLVLGPFQGLPACTRIPWGQGVCGTAAAQARSLRIDDVHAFDGHIACDPVSASELVVPLVREDQVIGVLDIDSPHKAHFSAQDQACAEALVELYIASMIRYPAQPPAW